MFYENTNYFLYMLPSVNKEGCVLLLALLETPQISPFN